jgi:hypothetical protein
VAKVGTSKAGGTISQQAVVHPWLAADAHGNKQNTEVRTANLEKKKKEACHKQHSRRENSVCHGELFPVRLIQVC